MRHYSRWQSAGEPTGGELVDWARRVAPNSHGREVWLRGLHPLAAAEVLYGLQARDREQIAGLRARQQAAGPGAPAMPVRSIVSERSLRNDLALTLADNRHLRDDVAKLAVTGRAR